MLGRRCPQATRRASTPLDSAAHGCSVDGSQFADIHGASQRRVRGAVGGDGVEGTVRVLLTTLPGYGSFQPLAAVARALREAGHDVAFAASATFCQVIASAGAGGQPFGAAGGGHRVTGNARLDLLAAAPEQAAEAPFSTAWNVVHI